jgi:hypothetical protein
MIPYQTKSSKLPGTRFEEVIKEARVVFREIERKTKRKPYVRSAYFDKAKIFFDYFWNHLYQKSLKERAKRLKYFKCAIELIEDSKNKPTSKENPNKKNEVLHRFAGLTKGRELFFVQIKEDKKTGNRDLMSVFPG